MVIERSTLYESALRCAPFLSCALRILAFAAALDALMALSLRSFEVNAFARASPPRRPISDMTFEIRSLWLLMMQIIHRRVTVTYNAPSLHLTP